MRLHARPDGTWFYRLSWDSPKCRRSLVNSHSYYYWRGLLITNPPARHAWSMPRRLASNILMKAEKLMHQWKHSAIEIHVQVASKVRLVGSPATPRSALSIHTSTKFLQTQNVCQLKGFSASFFLILLLSLSTIVALKSF